jgi:hypothetical protein
MPAAPAVPRRHVARHVRPVRDEGVDPDRIGTLEPGLCEDRVDRRETQIGLRLRRLGDRVIRRDAQLPGCQHPGRTCGHVCAMRIGGEGRTHRAWRQRGQVGVVTQSRGSLHSGASGADSRSDGFAVQRHRRGFGQLHKKTAHRPLMRRIHGLGSGGARRQACVPYNSGPRD